MFAKDALRDLFLHMEWADAQIWNAVMQSDAAQEDPTLRGLLLHLHVVQRAFLAVWTGSPVTFPDPGDFCSIAELRDFPRLYYREALAVLERVQEPALERVVIMPWAGQLATARS